MKLTEKGQSEERHWMGVIVTNKWLWLGEQLEEVCLIHRCSLCRAQSHCLGYFERVEQSHFD